MGEAFTYGELSAISSGLGNHLQSSVSAGKETVIVSDLPNISENLILQLACSHLKASFATVKDAEGLKALREAYNVVGCVPGMKDR